MSNHVRAVPAVLGVVQMLFAACAARQQDIPAPGAPAAGASDVPPLVDRDVFFGNAEILNARLSPDGRFVAFIKPVGGVMNIWVKDLRESWDAARPVTAETQRSLWSFFWSADGRYILYMQDDRGDDGLHLHAIDVAAGPQADGAYPARHLTPYDNIGVQIIAVPERHPEWILVGIDDRQRWLYDVYRLDLATGERTLVFRNESGLNRHFAADRDGNLRLGLRERKDGTGVVDRVRIDGQTITPVLACAPEEDCGVVRFHADARRDFMTRTPAGADISELILVDIGTGEVDVVERDPEGQVDFDQALFSSATGELLGTSYVADRVRIYPRNEQFERDLERIRAALPRGDLRLSAPTRDDRYRIVVNSLDVDMLPTYLYDRATGSVELLYRPQPGIPSEHMATMTAVRYQARDGEVIPAYLVLPKGVEPRNLPTVVMVHGGPFGRDYWGFHRPAQFLANRGYAVLLPNYRGSTGFGKKFATSGYKQWGSAATNDVADGADWLVEQGIAAPDRIGVMGASWGGYMTLAGLAFHPDRFAAGVDFFGHSSLVTFLESIPAEHREWWSVRFGDVDHPREGEELLRQSPLESVERMLAPLLVIRGANDQRVKKSESDQMVIALRELGRVPEYLVASAFPRGPRHPVCGFVPDPKR